MKGKHNRLSVIYETADPGKFPDFIKKAISVRPNTPDRIAKQSKMVERCYNISANANLNDNGVSVLSEAQYQEAKDLLRTFYS